MTNAALKMPKSPVSYQPKPDFVERDYQTQVTSRSRERGVILTLYGWNKLQTAKSQVEFEENAGDRFTLEELSERTELSSRTISKVLGCVEPVDRYSLQTVFQSFGLEMSKNDYIRPTSRSETSESQESQQINLWQKWNLGISGIDENTVTPHWMTSVCFSLDGKTLANSSSDFSVRIWDVQSGQCLNILQGHSSWIYSVCFSPDGRILATSSQDRTTKLWDVQTGECFQTLKGDCSISSEKRKSLTNCPKNLKETGI